MKRNLLFYSFLIITGLLMSNCKKDELVTVNGTISGKIIDASTNTGLADVSIAIKGTDITGTTNPDGTYIVSGIPSGEHFAVFTKTGYMISKSLVFIDLSGAASKKSSDVEFQVIMEDEFLFPLTGKANGVVFNEDGSLSNATGVRIVFNDSTFTATTDANGAFSFSALPFSPGNYINVSALKGDAAGYDDDYYGATASKPLGFKINLRQGGFQFLFGNYSKNVGNSNFPVTSNIELTFSDNINLATTLAKGSLKLLNSGTEVGIDITVSGNKLIINPKNDLYKDDYYSVQGNVYASEYRYTGIFESFTTIPTTAIIPLNLTEKPILSMNVGKTTLTITPPTGAKYIKIYRASVANPEYIYSTTISVGIPTTYNISSHATGTSYYVVAEGVDANGNTVYGAQSDVITK